jgi:WD40 repeat protein
MSLLPNGKILAWSQPYGRGITQVRLWDPSDESFANTNPLPSRTDPNDIFCTGHSFLPDGRLLVTGGHLGGQQVYAYGLEYTNIYNFETNNWSQAPDMNKARWYPTNCTLGNGEVLTIGGTDRNKEPNWTPQVWQASGTWRNLPEESSRYDRYYPWMHLAPNGRVFNAGPERSTDYLDPLTGVWSFVANTNEMNYRDYGSSIMYEPGKVMIAGGGPPTNSVEVIDLNTPAPAWRRVAPMAHARRHLNATLLPDGSVLATGGSSFCGFDNQDPAGAAYAAERWNPVTEKWSTLASAHIPRLYHSTALLLPDGRVLTAGGGNGEDRNKYNAEIFSPPYLFKGARPRISAMPAGAVNYGNTFSVGTPDALSITRVTMLRLGSVTHAFDQNQRMINLNFTRVGSELNVTAPLNGNTCPPGHYMLFILNGDGVPSVAKIIRIE